jgi:hypothetical protein
MDDGFVGRRSRMDHWFEQQRRLSATLAALAEVTDDDRGNGRNNGKLPDNERRQFGIWTRSKAGWFGESHGDATGSEQDAPEGHDHDRERF